MVETGVGIYTCVERKYSKHYRIGRRRESLSLNPKGWFAWTAG
jgi:hypothetical protein